MRKTLLAAATAILTATSALAMGGGGGGGYSRMPSNSTPTFDDYAVAQRLIDHEEYRKAIPHLMKALAKRPRDADILNYLGFAHRKVGVTEADAARDADFQRSLDFYRAALSIDPNHKGVHEYLGELYLAMNDLNAAHREMNTLVVLCPGSCDERDTLSKALAAYAPPAPAAAAPASPPSP
jgi:tetratricopeptide (TPR) repeat protein